MADKNQPLRKESGLSKEDVSKLAEFFHFMMKLDERNKSEGRYDKAKSAS